MSWGRAAVRWLQEFSGWLAWSAALLVMVLWAMAELVVLYDVRSATVAAMGPVATALAATAVLVVGVATVRQKASTDAREQWWNRVQWALDRALETGDAQILGIAALRALLKEPVTNEADVAMLNSAYGSLDLLGRFSGLGAE